jgi:hypothetical protein
MGAWKLDQGHDGPTEVHKWVVARNLLGTRR